MTPEEASAHLTAVLCAAREEAPAAWRDICVCFEAELNGLAKRKIWLGGFVIELFADAIRVQVLSVLGKKPEGYNHRGIWAVLYTLAMPRVLPVQADPFRISSIRIAHGEDPQVSYDRGFKIGLPLSLTEAYDPDAFKKLVQTPEASST